MKAGKNILLADTIHPVFKSMLEEKGFKITDATGWDPDALLSGIPDYNGLTIRSRILIDAEFLSHAHQFYFIARAGAGMENIDVAAAALKNIHCLNAPEGTRHAVGQHAIG